MKGYRVIKPFFHDKHHKLGDIVDFGDHINKQAELKGLIRWVERPVIVVKTKAKKRVRNRKK